MTVEQHQSKVVALAPDTEAVVAHTGDLILRSRGQFALLGDVGAADFRAIVSAIGPGRRLEELSATLAGQVDESTVRAVAEALQDLARPSAAEPRFNLAVGDKFAPVVDSPVLVVGNARLAGVLSAHLQAHGFPSTTRVDVAAFASHDTQRFRDACDGRVVVRHGSIVNAVPDAGHAVSVEGLTRHFAQASLVVCAIEGTFFRAMLDISAACVAARVPALFVTVDADAVHVGPTYVPGLSACFECINASSPESIRASLELFSTYTVASDETLERVAELVWTEAQAVASATATPQLITAIAAIPRQALMAPVTRHSPLLPAPSCACSAPAPDGLTRHLRIQADLAAINSRSDEPRFAASVDENAPDPYRTVAVIGGGTAGYFAALAIKAKLPHLEVTLVESSKVPIIGVGEATTPDLLYFLHGDLGFDLYDFYCTVRPTWKFGIKFFWGRPGDYYFNEPFARPRHAEALHYDGDINMSSFVSQLMSRELGPILETEKGPVFLLDDLTQGHSAYSQWCAYHLDNKRFVAYLAAQAKRRGIPYIDTQVTGAVKTSQGDEIDYLVTDDGQHLKFDVYIDCTGFRSALLEKEMGSEYISFDRSLFTDTAVVADVPHGGHLKPYTLAESMDSGWCWNIPQEESDHRGYVFSSAFCSIDQAAAEMRRKNPDMGDYRTVKFRSGRHAEFWKGNVIGIGNSYGFVEPLESTGIQIVIVELQALIRNFPKSKSDRAPKKVISHKVAGAWDFIRWFLAIHYKFNRKFDTPFWQECHRSVDISGMADLVALFQERAPLLTRHDADLIKARLTSDDLTFNLALVDTMLLGQGVPTATLEEPLESMAAWRHRARATERLLAQAVSHRRSLEILRERPEILGSIQIPGII